MDKVPNVREAYPLGNTSMDWYRESHEALDEEMDGFESADVAYVGGTMYGAAHQGEYPDSDVKVVENNPYAAALQSLAVDRLMETGDPDEARRAVFLQPLVENRQEIDYYPDGYWMPEEQVDDIVDIQEEFVHGDDRFPDSMTEGLNGNIGSFYGRHEEPFHTDEDLLNVDLAFTQNDTYLHLPDELDNLEHPSLVTEPVEDADPEDIGGNDVVYTNNVIDWFDDTEQFINSVERLGSDERFYLSTYTTAIHNSFEDPDDLAERIGQETGREVEVIPSEASGKVHQVTHGEPIEDQPTHNTEDIQAGENGALLRID